MRKKVIISLIFVIPLICFIYDQQLMIPHFTKKNFIDRRLFLYPLFPSLFIYGSGFILANFESTRQFISIRSFKIVIFILLLLFTHLVFVKNIEIYAQIVNNRNYFTILEAITPFLFIIIFRYLISIDKIKKIVESPYVLCIGILSLHFYFISNLLLGLLSITKESEPMIKIAGLIGIASLSYIFTFWKFELNYTNLVMKNS